MNVCVVEGTYSVSKNRMLISTNRFYEFNIIEKNGILPTRENVKIIRKNDIKKQDIFYMDYEYSSECKKFVLVNDNYESKPFIFKTDSETLWHESALSETSKFIETLL